MSNEERITSKYDVTTQTDTAIQLDQDHLHFNKNPTCKEIILGSVIGITLGTGAVVVGCNIL